MGVACEAATLPKAPPASSIPAGDLGRERWPATYCWWLAHFSARLA